VADTRIIAIKFTVLHKDGLYDDLARQLREIVALNGGRTVLHFDFPDGHRESYRCYYGATTDETYDYIDSLPQGKH
jgi:hypothetical protein